ncbi:MAG: (Fe-S)-binding protein [Chloroflexota bacterium]|nr:(Fe-S)-binding protein [Chloroflexota bacterium]
MTISNPMPDLTPFRSNRPTTVALFITCLVDIFRPQVGEATVRLLEQQGLRVEFPLDQTCCGAPAHHAGWTREATDNARHWIEVFEPFEAIVSPSATCVAMVRHEYPRLLASDAHWRQRAKAMAKRTFELSEFLVDVLGIETIDSRFEGKVTYHPACQLLRTLGIDRQPKALLAQVQDTEIVDLPDSDSCCGFGGPFSVQLPQIASAMAERKVRAIESSGADLVVTCETGCLLHIAGQLNRRDSPCQIRHLAELLAGDIA